MTKLSIAVVGLGITGASIASYLASRGHLVDGYDQFEPPHDRGSSHGENRLIRSSPSEGRIYVQMAARAYELWPEIERSTNQQLVFHTGCLDISEPGSDWAENSYRLAKEFGIYVEKIDIATARKLLPVFRFSKSMDVTYSPQSGTVLAEASVQAFLTLAKSHGCNLYFNRAVAGIDLPSTTVFLSLNERKRYDFIFLAAGGWIRNFVDIPVTIEKRVLGWYDAKFETSKMPGFIFDGRDKTIYGMAGSSGKSLKVGDDRHLAEEIHPDQYGLVSEADKLSMQQNAKKYLKNVDLQDPTYKACKYTLTNHKGFLIDRHPLAPSCVFFSACSGHGFKYAPVYGEIAESFINPSRKAFPVSLEEFSLKSYNLSVYS